MSNDLNIDPLTPEIMELVEKFPTNSHELLHNNSYFQYVCHFLKRADRFLELGYRKGMFVEVCRHLGVPSVHIDITDDLLRAESTPENKCFTISSVKYLRECKDSFDLIFQDGSKNFDVRNKEYRLIHKNGIIKPGGMIIVDDLHYEDCRAAYRHALRRCKWTGKRYRVYRERKDRQKPYIGIINIPLEAEEPE